MDWRKYIIVILLVMAVFGCNKKGKQAITTEFRTEEATTEAIENGQASQNVINMEEYEQILKNYGFKFPSEELYNKRLKEVFGIDLKDYHKKEFIEIKIDKEYEEESNTFPEAVVNKKFIYWDPIPNDDGWDNLAFVSLNKYIFYNDKAAFVYLKSKNGNAYLTRLVQYFGYDKDSQLMDYIFKKTGGTINNGYAYSLFIGRNGVNGKLQLRRELFNKYLEVNPNVDIYESRFIENIIGNKKYGGNKEADIAFLLDIMVVQCRNANYDGIFCGRVDDILLNNRDLRENFRKNKYYNFDELKGYVLSTFEVDFLNQYRKQINDPDGYTNLRSGKSTSSSIIDKLKTGTYVEVIDDSGDWWYVEVLEEKQGSEYKKGYVHKSKIK